MCVLLSYSIRMVDEEEGSNAKETGHRNIHKALNLVECH